MNDDTTQYTCDILKFAIDLADKGQVGPAMEAIREIEQTLRTGSRCFGSISMAETIDTGELTEKLWDRAYQRLAGTYPLKEET
jgi:hypothetical protein